MILIPYYIKPGKVTTAWIFMKEGKLWETDETNLGQKDITNLYFKPNGLVGKITNIEGNTVYYEINTKKTKLSEFYIWPESAADLWRPFFFMEEWKDEIEGFIGDFWKSVKCVKCVNSVNSVNGLKTS